MARTALAIQSPPGSYPALPLGAGTAAFTLAAADATNYNSFVSTGRELLLIENSGASPYTVTVHSVADNLQRTGDITAYSVAAGAFAWLGPFGQAGWKQSDGTVWVDASNVAVLLAVCRLPSIP